MKLLRKYFPGSAPTRRLFYRLDEWVKAQEVAIPAEKWLSKVEEFQNELGHPLPSNSSYLACRGSKPYLRGYTCGLWTMMHAVTVQAYKDEKTNPNFNPVDEVLEPIHQFIVQFLSKPDPDIAHRPFHPRTAGQPLHRKAAERGHSPALLDHEPAIA
uniref:Sulfhydryl oxidase flavin adenine dinucleotide (FAD) binding domain-containing protein n=1 Tax=Ditylenchus dipsaci TaxID=166011 RepID=A0A915EE49_9BILA